MHCLVKLFVYCLKAIIVCWWNPPPFLGASVGDQIKPTKPIAPASSSPPDANINIFNNRPSIQYMNPSKLPTIPDDLRPPTPPAPQPQGQGN